MDLTSMGVKDSHYLNNPTIIQKKDILNFLFDYAYWKTVWLWGHVTVLQDSLQLIMLLTSVKVYQMIYALCIKTSVVLVLLLPLITLN